MGEFDFIRERLAPLAADLPGARGLTDDAATLLPDAGREIVVTADALVSGVHFREADPLDLVAQKALRVNLSDLAAKGAEPLGYLLSIVWPTGTPLADKERFVEGLAADQARFGVGLLGGDTTSGPGPLVVAITALGRAGPGGMIPRSGAKPGDVIYVTGEIGDASLEIALGPKERATLTPAQRAVFTVRYLTPEPRLRCVPALREHAHAAIDVSDGLLADAGHMARTSGVRIDIDAEAIPLSPAGAAWIVLQADQLAGLAQLAAGGDDYEVLFAAPAGAGEAVASASGLRVTAIGRAVKGEGVRLLDIDGVEIRVKRSGFTHF